ncbi:MAG: mechanosensitive ion channel family protein [Holophagae bacterium]|jgi:small-conductance mechanosensitive channel
MSALQTWIEGWLPLAGTELWGNPAAAWAVAALVVIVAYGALRVSKAIVIGRLKKVAAKTTTPWDDITVGAAETTRFWFYLAISIWLGSRFLDLSDRAARSLTMIAVVAVILQVTVWANRAVTLWLERTQRERAETDPGAVTTLTGLSYVLRLVIWSAGFLLVLDNVGVNVTALMAGLGVGGIAVALAVQNVLGDLFASLSIALDKPFVIGDFVIVGEFMGTVEHIGLKTTRVRSLSGEQLVFSNSDLLSSRIRNYKRMQERRVPFIVGVTYQTPASELEAIPGMVRDIIESTEHTRFDRAHFKAFGDSAYLFEFVYYVLSAEYPVYMDVQQGINLEIVRRFAERGIEIAYPTRTLHMATPVTTEVVDARGDSRSGGE